MNKSVKFGVCEAAEVEISDTHSPSVKSLRSNKLLNVCFGCFSSTSHMLKKQNRAKLSCVWKHVESRLKLWWIKLPVSSSAI